MKSTICLEHISRSVDLTQGIDLSIAVQPTGPKAWYVDPPTFTPVMENGFIGAVAQGGSVNFRNVFFNPHGHGTHTESVGHIATEVYSVNQNLNNYFYWAELKTVSPSVVDNDFVITLEQISDWSLSEETKALVIRTLPNDQEKLSRTYSDSNPPYFHVDAIQWLVAQGIEHLLVDLPSIDREVDNGVLAGHHAFWQYPNKPRMSCTITEFIYVPNNVLDGLYLLNLQVAAFENDAAPSRPVLFPLSN